MIRLLVVTFVMTLVVVSMPTDVSSSHKNEAVRIRRQLQQQPPPGMGTQYGGNNCQPGQACPRPQINRLQPGVVNHQGVISTPTAVLPQQGFGMQLNLNPQVNTAQPAMVVPNMGLGVQQPLFNPMQSPQPGFGMQLNLNPSQPSPPCPRPQFNPVQPGGIPNMGIQGPLLNPAQHRGNMMSQPTGYVNQPQYNSAYSGFGSQQGTGGIPNMGVQRSSFNPPQPQGNMVPQFNQVQQRPGGNPNMGVQRPAFNPPQPQFNQVHQGMGVQKGAGGIPNMGVYSPEHLQGSNGHQQPGPPSWGMPDYGDGNLFESDLGGREQPWDYDYGGMMYDMNLANEGLPSQEGMPDYDGDNMYGDMESW